VKCQDPVKPVHHYSYGMIEVKFIFHMALEEEEEEEEHKTMNKRFMMCLIISIYRNTFVIYL
jgi:hypothetical protein